MKKIILLLLLSATVIFTSCDLGSVAPKVTVAEAQSALAAVITGMGPASQSARNGATSGNGWTATESTSGNVKTYSLVFTNFPLTGIAEYDSISGSETMTVTMDGATPPAPVSMTLAVSVTFTGSGPVVSVEMDLSVNLTTNAATFSKILVNGHDMKSDLGL